MPPVITSHDPLLHPVGTLREALRQTTYYITLVASHETTPENELFANHTLVSLQNWAATAAIGFCGIDSPEYRFRNQPEAYQQVKASLQEIAGVFRKLDYANSVMAADSAQKAIVSWPAYPHPTMTTESAMSSLYIVSPASTQYSASSTTSVTPFPTISVPPAAPTPPITTSNHPPLSLRPSSIPKSRRFLQMKAAGVTTPRPPPSNSTPDPEADLSDADNSSASSCSSSTGGSFSPSLSESSQSDDDHHEQHLHNLTPKPPRQGTPATVILTTTPTHHHPQTKRPVALTATNDSVIDSDYDSSDSASDFDPDFDGPYGLCDWEYLGDTRDIIATRDVLVSTSTRALQQLHTLTPSLISSTDAPLNFQATTNGPQELKSLWPKWTATACVLTGLMNPRIPAYLQDRQSFITRRSRLSCETSTTRGFQMVYTDAPAHPCSAPPDDIELLINPDILDPDYIIISCDGPTSTPKEAAPATRDAVKITREQFLGGIPRCRSQVGAGPVQVTQEDMKERKKFGHSCGKGPGKCLEKNPELINGWKADFNHLTQFPPKAPEIQGHQGVCPYCDCIFSAEEFTSDRWRAHVIRDLQPYFCPLPDCPTWAAVPQTLSSLMHHLTHTHTPVLYAVLWNGKFHRYTTEDLSQLQNTMEVSRYEALVRNMVEVRTDYEFLTCPFCDGVPGDIEGMEGEGRREGILRHVEGHMLRGALVGTLGGCEMGRAVRMVGYLRGEGKGMNVEWPVEIEEEDGVLIV